jgi:hypothetical protein
MKRGINHLKKGQQTLGMSFGTIFSIFLMIFFVVVAGIAINYLLKTQQCAKLGIFIDKLNTEVTSAWHSQKSDFPLSGSLPSKIEYICFANLSMQLKGPNEKIGEDLSIYEYENANMFFYPIGKSCEMEYHNVLYLDIEYMIKKENPYCIPVNKGLVKMKVEKGFSDRLVKISK